MSNKSSTSPAVRWQLLSTVSALALIASSTAITQAQAGDADRPLVWIELGGEVDQMTGQGELFSPHFIVANATAPVLQGISPLRAQKPPVFGFGEDGQISFQPDNSDWLFSASIRYGRLTNSRHVHNQPKNTFAMKYANGEPYNSSAQFIAPFSDTYTKRRDSNIILDFSAGKDVGLGLFGTQGSSNLALDVRFAQFVSKASFDIMARPELEFKYRTLAPFGHPSRYLKLPHFNNYQATGYAARSFHGVGPLLTWTGSAAIAGNVNDGEVALDWGLDAGILFGRQKAHVRHQETAYYRSPLAFAFHPSNLYFLAYRNPPRGHVSDRAVSIPNVGGSIGLSVRYADAKISLGYRADLFMNAMDTGIDKRNSSNVLFHGPYASISIGVGD